MNIIYPDFAFSAGTQVVLFIVSCLGNSLCYLWGAKIIMLLLQKKATVSWRLIFCALLTVLLHFLVVYSAAFINGVVINKTGQLDIGNLDNMSRLANPLFYFLLYWCGVRVMRLSQFQSARCMHMMYVYSLCCTLFLRISATFLFPQLADPRGWNYLRDMCSICGGTLLVFFFYLLCRYCIKRFRLHVDFPDNIVVKNLPREQAISFLRSVLVYAFALFGLHHATEPWMDYIYMLVILCGYIVIYTFVSHKKIYQGQLANRDAHIAALSESIEDFRGIRHDFHNILQTYSGYLAIKDYDMLGKYHTRMINTILDVETTMELNRRIPECPPFFSLVISKIEQAQARQVDFRYDIVCDMNDLHIDVLDFCRIISVFLDNAIEAAELTGTKQMHFSGQVKPDHSVLFIISNDTDDELNTTEIFKRGYTTKDGHMGLGLPTVRSIIQKYGNCTLSLNSYRGSFTVYFEVKPV